MSLTTQQVSFDGNQLTNVPGLTILSTDPYTPPKRFLGIAALSREDKSKVNSAFYRERAVTVHIGISRGTRPQLEQSLDALWLLLHGIEKDLILPQSIAANGGPGVRKYICTLADQPVSRDGGSYIEIDLVFACSDSFGYDTIYTTALTLTGITSSNRGDVFPIIGSAPWQVPVVTVFYTAAVGGLKSVTIGNGSTGQGVTITRNWTVGDRIEIDAYNDKVKVNGIEIDYVGAIPRWAGGLGSWAYSDTLTSRTFNADIIYYPRWN